MSSERPRPATTPCLCDALHQATRAVSRLYDEDLREAGLRTTQYALLAWLRFAGEVRQRDLGKLTSLSETTLTRNLRPLIGAGWTLVLRILLLIGSGVGLFVFLSDLVGIVRRAGGF